MLTLRRPARGFTVTEMLVAVGVVAILLGLGMPSVTGYIEAAKLNAAAKKAAQSTEFRKQIEPEGLTVAAGSPQELATYVKNEEERWRRIVKENNVKAD